METLITKDQLEEIKKVEGEIRGLALKNYGSYISRKEGSDGLEKIEKTMEEIGCEMPYKNLNSLAFYPLWWSAATFFILRNHFEYGEEEFYEMGKSCFRFPNIMRIWARFLISIEKAASSADKMYEMYFTVGEITVPDYSVEEKYVVMRLKDFPTYPIDKPQLYCCFLAGYYSSIIKAITGKDTKGEERKCAYSDAGYHEFLLTW